jgi:8-oxo-dGTP pyrophosphatase MutT (NUDIX family)
MADYTWLLRRIFTPGQIRSAWVDSTRRLVPEVEAAIDRAWTTATSRPGVTLFDGPIARCERWTLDAHSDQLHLELSKSSYRISVGTHFSNPQFFHQFGPEVMSMAVGVSTGLFTAEGLLVMGVRTAGVAYYPGRVHPFAGSLEVRDNLDVFDDARRELCEELNLSPEHIVDLRCVGIAQDDQLLHPELVFLASTKLSFDQLRSQLDPSEHTALVAVETSNDSRLTPIARAVVDAARPSVVS